MIQGVIYLASPDNTDANELFVWLISLLHDFADWFDLGRVYGSRVAFRLDDMNGPEPDIAFVRTERLRLVRGGYVQGGPDRAVELVSPDSVERDYIQKRAQFEEAGLTEYWIVDEMKKKVTLLHLDAKGKFREVRPRKGILRSKVLTDFWLRPDWLWQNARPKKVQVLQQILAGEE